MIGTMLAMHMANELLSIPVAAVTLAVALGAVALAAVRAGKTLDSEKLPLMGVMGAFVFAAQMINFAVLPGTSGHLGGGVLLAILLGPAAGIVTMAAILIVQCLLFQDGGLLALGTNIINMGVVPCLLGWCAYKLMLGSGQRAKAWRQYIAAWGACLVGVTLGAALVPVEALASGVLKIPVADFLTVMVGVHLLIGFVEGLITFAVIAYIRSVRPSVLGLDEPEHSAKLSSKAMAGSLVVTALLLGGVVSWFACEHPDGLEWSYQEKQYAQADSAVQNDSPVIASVDDWQARWAPMSDYTRREASLGQLPDEDVQDSADAPADQAAIAAVDGWVSLAGLLGTAVTLGIVYLVSALVRRRSGVSESA